MKLVTRKLRLAKPYKTSGNFSLRLDPVLQNRLREEAIKRGLSVASFIRGLIVVALEVLEPYEPEKEQTND